MRRLEVHGHVIEVLRSVGFLPDTVIKQTHIARLRYLRASRSAAEVETALARLEQTAHDAGNLMPPILDAAAARATVGEISDRLRRVFGEYRDTAG